MGGNPKGRRGEDFAAETIAAAGYTVLDRNVHSRYGEVDIVARKGGVICFVEVKARRRGALVSGAEAVGRAKQRRIIHTALLYLQRRPELDLQPRFDVFTLETGVRSEVLSYEWLEGAFDGQDYGG